LVLGSESSEPLFIIGGWAADPAATGYGIIASGRSEYEILEENAAALEIIVLYCRI
jgi:hypothetical protein